MKFQIPIDNIKRIVNFYFETEQKHYDECNLYNCKHTNDHIFHDIRMVHSWLNIFEKLE